MVGTAAFCISRLLRLHCLLHLGSSSGPALQVWSVSFSDVFTGIVWRSFACMVRNKTGVDAGMGYSSDADPVGPWRLPSDLLILSWSELKIFLGVPSLVYRGGAQQYVLWFTPIFSDLSNSPLILSFIRES